MGITFKSIWNDITGNKDDKSSNARTKNVQAGKTAKEIEDEEKNFFEGVGTWFKNTTEKVVDAVEDAADWVEDKVDDAKDWVDDKAEDAEYWAKKTYSNTAQWFDQSIKDTKDWVEDKVDDAEKWGKTTYKDTEKWIENAIEDTEDWVDEKKEKVEESYNEVKDWTDKKIQDAKKIVAKKAEEAEKIFDKAKEKAKDSYEKANDWADDNIWDKLSKTENLSAEEKLKGLDLFGQGITSSGEWINKTANNLFDNVINKVDNISSWTNEIAKRIPIIDNQIKRRNFRNNLIDLAKEGIDNGYDNAKEWLLNQISEEKNNSTRNTVDMVLNVLEYSTEKVYENFDKMFLDSPTEKINRIINNTNNAWNQIGDTVQNVGKMVSESSKPDDYIDFAKALLSKGERQINGKNDSNAKTYDSAYNQNMQNLNNQLKQQAINITKDAIGTGLSTFAAVSGDEVASLVAGTGSDIGKMINENNSTNDKIEKIAKYVIDTTDKFIDFTTGTMAMDYATVSDAAVQEFGYDELSADYLNLINETKQLAQTIVDIDNFQKEYENKR